jgi:hypothetical protein
MTPEALAEIQGHTEVIRVMRAWESLHPSSHGDTYSETTGLRSPSIDESEDGWNEGQQLQPSRKGKERAFSFSSAKSELSVPGVKVKRSIEGFFRRSSRSGSSSNPTEPTPLRISTYSDGSTEVSNPDSPAYYSPFVDSAPSSPHFATADEAGEDDEFEESLTRVTSGNSTILAPPYAPFRASSPGSNVSGGSSTVLASARQPRSEPPLQDTIDETESNASEYEQALETLSQESLHAQLEDNEETQSNQQESEETVEEIPSYHRHALPQRHGYSSRRPSLPAILEKAAHPGQTFRNAMRRDRHASESIPNIPEDPSQPKSGSFLRGRKTANDASPRRFGFKGFFRRGASPPSRSPSPPKQNAILPDELDERLRRASLDMQSEGSSADAMDEVYVPPKPHSAPPTRTRFFEDLSDNSDLRMAALASLAPKPTPPPIPPPVRKVSGGVLVPSPLAKEWKDQDIAPTNEGKFRRSRTEIYRGGTPSPRHSVPGTPVQTKKRSATLPSQPRGLDWDEEVSLRRAAASEVIRRNSEKLRQAVHDAGRNNANEAIETDDRESQGTPHESEGEDETDLTPEATPAVEKPETEAIAECQGQSPNRLRGASIGSFTTDSTRLSTPSQSTNPHMSIASGGNGSELYATSTRSPQIQTDKIPPRVPSNSVVSEGRARGNTVSSYSSGTSGMNFSTGPSGSASTPGTSLTPTSAVGTFPPVPEHEVAPTSPRKALTREEAKKLVKQNEQDILQLAKLPSSVDSSRSLAEQLAAYGENHQLEQQIAAEERRSKRRAARASRSMRGSDGESFVSATDGESISGESSSGRTTGSSALRMTTIKHDKGESCLHWDDANVLDGMYRVAAPKNQIPSINTIYDKRAAAYREKLQALTSIPPTVPPSLRNQAHNTRQRAYSTLSSQHQTSAPSSLRHVSSPFPATATSSRPKQVYTPSTRSIQQDGSRYTLHPQTPPGTGSSFMTAPSSLHKTYSHQQSQRRKTHPPPPPPIADVVNARFSGMAAPPPAPPMSASPYVSIFSSRYSGHPHDGGDSDDSDSEPQRYTVVENDWKGTNKADKIDHDGMKRNKWGQLKGAIGHLGRKTS